MTDERAVHADERTRASPAACFVTRSESRAGGLTGLTTPMRSLQQGQDELTAARPLTRTRQANSNTSMTQQQGQMRMHMLGSHRPPWSSTRVRCGCLVRASWLQLRCRRGVDRCSRFAGLRSSRVSDVVSTVVSSRCMYSSSSSVARGGFLSPHARTSVSSGVAMSYPTLRLRRRLDVQAGVSERDEVLDVAARDVATSARLHREALDLNARGASASGLLDLLVLADAVEEVIAAGRLLHVLDAHMDLLADDAVAVELVHLDTDGARGDVPDDTGLTMVELVREALLHRSVTLDVDEVADLVHVQVGRERDVSVLAEVAGKQVARVRAVTVRVRHGDGRTTGRGFDSCGGGRGRSADGRPMTEHARRLPGRGSLEATETQTSDSDAALQERRDTR